MSRRWRDCQGLWPQIVRFFCRRHHRWAQEIAFRAVCAEIDDERTAAVLTACLQSGEPVIGSVDDQGEFTVRPAKEKPNG